MSHYLINPNWLFYITSHIIGEDLLSLCSRYKKMPIPPFCKQSCRLVLKNKTKNYAGICVKIAHSFTTKTLKFAVKEQVWDIAESKTSHYPPPFSLNWDNYTSSILRTVEMLSEVLKKAAFNIFFNYFQIGFCCFLTNQLYSLAKC